MLLAVLVLPALSAAPLPASAAARSLIAGAGEHGRASEARVRAAFDRLPLPFEPNVGQSARHVRYVAHAAGATTFLTAHDIVVALSSRTRSRVRGERAVIRLAFAGAGHARLRASHRLPGSVNYLLGRASSQWRTGIPTYARVCYDGLWQGIALCVHGSGSRLEYAMRVEPGADPRLIGLRLDGARRAFLRKDGTLVLDLPGGRVLEQSPPVSYQAFGRETRVVPSHFVLSRGILRLVVGRYDRSRPLEVDPTLVYSTYLGGTGADVGTAVAVDGAGQAYVTGYTSSANFPAVGPAQGFRGASDAFVAKLDAAGNALVYSTFLGGSSTDAPYSVAIDGSGDAYLAGLTYSPDFPVAHAVKAKCADAIVEGRECTLGDAFVAELNPAGAGLVYSSYLGGSGADFGFGVAVDATGAAYVVGETASGNFPVTPGHDVQGENAGKSDAFVAKVAPGGGTLDYSTYLGGAETDVANKVSVDAAGDAYVAGGTESPDFPRVNAAQGSYGGAGDGFVAKLDPGGGALLYSTYLGGSGSDYVLGLTLDGSGDAYVTGPTKSLNFPTLSAAQASCGDAAGGCALGDAFATKLAANGSFAYSTYLGGAGADEGFAIAVDGAGEAFVTGVTESVDFPTANPLQVTPGGTGDAFVTKLGAGGNALVYSTYLGGSGHDVGIGIAVDGGGDAYVAGFTKSTNFPTVGALQAACADVLCVEGDAFVTKLPSDVTAPTSSAVVPACRGAIVATVVDEPGGSGPRAVDYRLDSGPVVSVPTAGSPGSAAIAVPEGSHSVEYWGEDNAGNQEAQHHLAAVQIDTTAPALAIASDQHRLAYEVGDPASVTVTAQDAVSGLASDPSGAHVPLSTAAPGRFTFTRSALDRCGNASSASFTYTVVPFPVLAISVNVDPVAGRVLLRKGATEVALTEPRSLPVGSVIDASAGTVKLTSATAARNRYQSGVFSAGVFQVLQRRSQHGLTQLNLIDPSSQRCARAGKASAARRRLSSRVLAQLRSDAHGRFTTHGRYAAATVRGTAWTMQDRCDGTLTAVTRGVVVVRDYRLQRNISVRAGKSYLARVRSRARR